MQDPRTRRYLRAMSTLVAICGCTMSLAAAGAADIKVGSWSKFKCTGPYDSEYRYEVTEVNGDMVRFDVDRDGKSGWLMKSLDHVGTTLFKSRDRSDGKGKRGQKIRGKFDEITEFVVGKTFSGRVDEWHSQSQWTWKYTVTVGKRESIDHALLGTVEVVTINESRRVEGGSYSSKMKTVRTVAMPGRTIGWEYTDEKGTQKCQIESHS